MQRDAEILPLFTNKISTELNVVEPYDNLALCLAEIEQLYDLKEDFPQKE